MAANSTKTLFTVFLTINFLQIKADQTPLEEVRVGLLSENDTYDLNKTLNRLSTDEEDIEDDSFFMEHISGGNLTCLSCQPPNCDHPKFCNNALSCYTAHTSDADGFVSKSKGNYQNHISWIPTDLIGTVEFRYLI